MSELILPLKWLIYAVAAYVGLTVAIPLIFIGCIILFFVAVLILIAILWFLMQIQILFRMIKRIFVKPKFKLNR